MKPSVVAEITSKDICLFPNVHLDNQRLCDTCNVKEHCECSCKKLLRNIVKSNK